MVRRVRLRLFERSRSTALRRATTIAAIAASFLIVAVPNSGATFPGINGKIVFASTRDPGGYDIFVMNPDGSGQTNLTNTPAIEEFNPVWSPDGTKIAYSSLDNPERIYVMSANGDDQTQLTFGDSGGDGAPTWTPDGSGIVFVRATSTDEGVYEMNADGSGLHLLFNAAVNGRLAFSPDGTKFAYAKYNGLGYSIFVRNSDGTGETQLTDTTTAIDLDPSWSPDSKTLIFQSDRATSPGGLQAIYLMNADGSGQRALTTPTLFTVRPTWSPDGTKIAFSNGATSTSHVWVMNADGSGMTDLTPKSKAYNINPDWAPRPASPLTMGPQAIEGDLRVAPGTTLKTGYDFAIPGTHPAENVSFGAPHVTFQATCISGGGGGTINVTMPDASYPDPLNFTGWVPSSDKSDPSVYQGSTSVPDLCGGGILNLKQGGRFATTVLWPGSERVNVRWHYSANGSPGSWSSTQAVSPN